MYNYAKTIEGRWQLERRDFIFGTLSLAILAPTTSGCLLGFAGRLLVTRAMASTIGRAALAGRSASALTLGRGAAISTHLLARRGVQLRRANIVGPKSEVIARSQTIKDRTTVKYKDAPIFHSQRKDYGFDHYDYNGEAGKSIDEKKGLFKHLDIKGKVIAVDRVLKTRNVIEHLSPEGQKFAETQYDLTDEGASVRTDETAVAQIDDLARQLGLHCEDARDAYLGWYEAEKACAEGGDCSGIAMKNSRFELLRARCKAGF